MGLWDVFDYAVKKPVTKTYDLGRVAVSKTIDGAVQIPTVTKSVLTSSYALGCAAVSKSVGDDGVLKQWVKEYLPGPENRDKIFQALTHPATKKALKLVAPGGAQAASIVGSVGSVLLLGKGKDQNLDDDEQNKYEHVIQQLKLLQAENEKMKKELNKLVQQLKLLQAENEKMKKELNKLVMTTNNSSSSSTVAEQKPEEVIVELNKGLKIKDLLDNHRVVPIRGKL